MKQFFQLIRFELLIQLKTWAAPIFGVIYFGFAFLMGGQGAASFETVYNSEYQFFFKLGLLSLGGVFSIMFFVVKATQRDSQSRMEGLIFVTPVSKGSFFMSRLIGAWIVSLLVFLPSIIGFCLGVAYSDLDPSRILDFQLAAGLSVAFKLLIPTLSTLVALLFTVGLLTKNPLATYATAVGIYAAYFICSIFLNSPLLANAAPVASENLVWTALADPFGISAFFHQTNLWTSYEKNNLGIQFSGLFAWNRALWLTFSLGVLAIGYRIFSFREAKEKHKMKQKEDDSGDLQNFSFEKINPQTGDFRAVFRSQLRLSVQFILKNYLFWMILGAWIIIAVTEIYFKLFSGGSYEESFYPATQILLDRVQQPLFLFGIILLIFFSGSLTWREKDYGMQELVSATPAPKGLIFLSHFTTLALVIITMLSLTVLVCLGFQLFDNSWTGDKWALLSLYLSPGWSMVFFSIIFLLIQRYTPHKYIGMGLSAISFGVFAGPLSSTLGLSHPLFLVGSTPFLTYSEMTGFDYQWSPFLNLSLLWGILAVAIALWLYFFWDQTFSFRNRKVFKKPVPRLALLFTVIFLGLWGGYFLKTLREGSFIPTARMLDQKARYEQEFQKYKGAPVLAYADLRIDLDLRPSERNFKAKVSGKLVNPSSEPIRNMLIQEKEKLRDFNLEKVEDFGYIEELMLYQISFSEAVLPGDSLEFSFSVEPQSTLLQNHKAVVQNGSYLNLRDFAPFFGYSESMEIKDYSERKKRGLPPKAKDDRDDSHSGVTENNLYKVGFEAIVKTDRNQTAITSGNLIEERLEGNQRVFHFHSPEPILPAVGFFSGVYQVDSVQYGDVMLKVYSAMKHGFANEKTLKVMQDALEYCSTTFGKYPFDHMNLVEVPGFWGFGGYAHPGVISMTEDKYFLVKEGTDQFDLQTKRAVHEVAHQWFGHLLAPRNVPGASLFVEGLAKYAEVLLLEKSLGKAATWYLSDQANRTYFQGRATAIKSEQSLAEQENQSYLAYGKSLSAFLAARDLLGEEVLNAIIRELVSNSLANKRPVVDSQVLLDKMKKETNPKGQKLLEDWFQKVMIYDLQILDAQIEESQNGLYQLTLNYHASKLEQQANGTRIEVPLDEEIELAAFAVHPKALNKEDDILFAQKVRLKSGRGQVQISLDQLPQVLALDPWGTRPDQNREDNFYEMR